MTEINVHWLVRDHLCIEMSSHGPCCWCWLWFNVTFSDISAICWRDRCPVSKFLPAAGHPLHGQLGVFSVPSLPRHGHRDVRSFYILAIRGPTRGEGKRGIEPGSSDPKSSPLPLRHRGGPHMGRASIMNEMISKFFNITYRNRRLLISWILHFNIGYNWQCRPYVRFGYYTPIIVYRSSAVK